MTRPPRTPPPDPSSFEQFEALLAAGYTEDEARQRIKPDTLCRHWACFAPVWAGTRSSFCHHHATVGRAQQPRGVRTPQPFCSQSGCTLFARQGKATCSQHWMKEPAP